MNKDLSRGMKTEEFTFPRVYPNNVEHLTVIPSLWRISSLVHSNRTDFELENGRKGKIFRKSYSDVEGEMKKEAEEEEEEEEEEKMDMLWEDFNEELIHQSISCVESSFSDSETMEEECNSCHLKMSKTCSDTVSPKKKNLVLLVNVFKKLFLLQNMASIKKRVPH